MASRDQILEILREVDSMTPEQLAKLSNEDKALYADIIKEFAQDPLDGYKLNLPVEAIDSENSADIKGRQPVEMFSNSQYDAIKYLEDKNPGVTFGVQGGEIYAKKSGEQWKPIDKAGLEMADLPRFALDALGGLGSAALGTGAAALATPTTPVGMAAAFMAGEGAGGAGWEAARQGVGKLMGVNSKMDLGDVALQGGLSAATGGLTFGLKPGMFLKDGVFKNKALREKAVEAALKYGNVERNIAEKLTDAELSKYLGQSMASVKDRLISSGGKAFKAGFQGISGKNGQLLDTMASRAERGLDYSPILPNDDTAYEELQRKAGLSMSKASKGAVETAQNMASGLEEQSGGRMVNTNDMYDIVRGKLEQVKREAARPGANPQLFQDAIKQLKGLETTLAGAVDGKATYKVPFSTIQTSLSTLQDLDRQVQAGNVDAVASRFMKDVQRRVTPMMNQALDQAQPVKKSLDPYYAKSVQDAGVVGSKLFKQAGDQSVLDLPAITNLAVLPNKEADVQYFNALRRSIMDRPDLSQDQKITAVKQITKQLNDVGITNILRADTPNVNLTSTNVNPLQSIGAKIQAAAMTGTPALAKGYATVKSNYSKLANKGPATKLNSVLNALGNYVNTPQYDAQDPEAVKSQWNSVLDAYQGGQ